MIMDIGSKISHLTTDFQINEATIDEIQLAFQRDELTSTQLVQHYLDAIKNLQETLHAVIEVNPDALAEAQKADIDRKNPYGCSCSRMKKLHGIPVLLKDNIGTNDKLNTTCGSFALLGSVVPRDAGVVYRLRQAGAIILGKAGLSEWAYFRSPEAPAGWSARGGTVINPYVLLPEAGGSSSGSAVGVAANLATVSLGTETSGSIMIPCHLNCVVGIKPTVGLTSRSGVIPITSRQDSVGTIGRTVADAVYLLDVIVGGDPRDELSNKMAKHIPQDGYAQFLKRDGLKGKRIGNMWNGYEGFFDSDSPVPKVFQQHIETLSKNGALLVNYENPDFIKIMTEINDNINTAFYFEFKRDLNIYLSNLVKSPIRSLADAIAFNKANPELEKLDEYGQEWFIESEKRNLPSSEYTEIVNKLDNLSKEVFEKFMHDNSLDAVVVPEANFFDVLGIRGCPAIMVPAGFYEDNMPFGILFGGFKQSEGTLIEIAYAFEQATKVRRPPVITT